jgi:guanylate kinase
MSGPSGGGKTTLCNVLVVADANIVRSISMTTRPARRGEIDGRDYFFVTKAEFRSRVKRGEFLEWANVFGHCYGTPGSRVQKEIRKGRTVILTIDVQGAKQVRRKYPDGIFVFVLPPSKRILRARLVDRQSDTAGEIKKRLKVFDSEIREIKHYEYVVVNDSVRQAVMRLRAIIEAEKCRNIRVLDC